MAALATLVPAAASANPFDLKAQLEPMPISEALRPTKLDVGWIEFGFRYDAKIGLGRFGPDGSVNLFDNGTDDPSDDTLWLVHTPSLHVRWGLSRRLELFWDLPYKVASLNNGNLGTRTVDHSLGDPTFGARLEIIDGWEEEAGNFDLVFETWVKNPAAKESPGSYIGGPLNVTGFVFTSGTFDWWLGAAGKVALSDGFSIGGRLGYLVRWGGIVQYLVALDSSTSGRMDPGDEVRAELDLIGDFGPAALRITPRFAHRQLTRVGTTSAGLSPNQTLKPVAGSDGITLDVDAALTFHVSRTIDIWLFGSMPLVGEDLTFFPIEDLHPTWGPRVGGALEVRY